MALHSFCLGGHHILFPPVKMQNESSLSHQPKLPFNLKGDQIYLQAKQDRQSQFPIARIFIMLPFQINKKCVLVKHLFYFSDHKHTDLEKKIQIHLCNVFLVNRCIHCKTKHIQLIVNIYGILEREVREVEGIFILVIIRLGATHRISFLQNKTGPSPWVTLPACGQMGVHSGLCTIMPVFPWLLFLLHVCR